MGLVARPPKAAGTSQYQTEFAAGAIGIQDTELDADFETLYRLVNGNIDSSNIAYGAAITYDQLSLTGRIVNADISSAANIDGHKIAAGTIPTSALGAGTINGSVLAPGTVPASALVANSVGLAQLNFGAATNFIQAAGIPSQLAPTNPGQELWVMEIPWTSRGGWYVVLAAIYGIVGADGNTPAVGLGITLRNGGTSHGVDGTNIGGSSFNGFAPAAGISFYPYGIVTAQSGTTGKGAASLIKMTVTLTGRLVGTCQVQDGWMFIAEFA
jgi:hypothetical protein